MQIKLRESLEVAGVGRVDRAAATIRDVRVCGVKSRNGRRYSPTALKNAVRLYEGARVFIDHPEGDGNARKFRERFGRLVNVREAGDGGITADLKYNPRHRDAEQFLWLAEHDPAGMGLSHNAEGRGIREAGGDVLVEEIQRVHSVDIVDGPATNISLYEQDQMEPLTDPAAPASPDAATGADGADFGAQLADLAKSIAAHPEWDKATKIAKLKALIGMLEDGDADAKQSEESGEKPDAEPSDDEMMEQLRVYRSPAARKAARVIAREQARKFAAAKGLKAELVSDVFVEQLAAAPLKLREAIVEDRKRVGATAGAEKPRSGAASPATAKTPAEIAATLFG